jgi:hypothetical protein
LEGDKLHARYEFKMNSPELLTLVSDTGSVGLHWADRWPVGPCALEIAGPPGELAGWAEPVGWLDFSPLG